MTKTKRSNRGRKKKGSSVTTSKNQNRKQTTPKNKRKTSQKSPTSIASNSDTSPFKGFDENVVLNVPKLYESDVDKDDIFDRLFDYKHQTAKYKNIRTYTNKNKLKKENSLLEFHDCKNRDDILKWLNSTQNVFDRVTQTQDVSQNNDEITILDMPSVSQRDVTKINRSHTRERKVNRSPYKLRAKSLDVQIKKNLLKGRSKSHSLAGDSPDMENYHIEDYTDEENLISVENEAAIIDLMEDEYLDNLEKEMMQKEDKKNQSVSGWDRIKDINKSLNKFKKQPKQLKIVKTSPDKNLTLNNNNNYKTFEYDILENYFIENMEKVMKENEGDFEDKNGQTSALNNKNIKRNIIGSFEKLLDSEDNDFIEECKSVFKKLQLKFEKQTQEISTQTLAIVNVNKCIQTEIIHVNATVQTENVFIHTGIQTENILYQNCAICINNMTEKPQIVNLDETGQIEAKPHYQPQNDLKTSKIIHRVSPTTSTTPSDILFMDEEDKQSICEAFKTDFEAEGKEKNSDLIKVENKNAQVLNRCGSIKLENDVFDDDLVFAMDTEEFMKSETEGSKVTNSNQRSDKDKTQESVLIVSEGIKNETVPKGIKRVKSESPVCEAGGFKSKRPCAKFIRDDLTMEFSACVEDDLECESREDADDLNSKVYLERLFEKSFNENEAKTTPEVSLRTRTQEQLEELENKIYNITNAKRTPKKEILKKSFTKQDDHIFLENTLVNEIETPGKKTSPNSCKSGHYSDYFESFSVDVDIGSEKIPRKSRRNLFNSNNEKKQTSRPLFSESIFVDDKDETIAANQTLTRDNVDELMKEVNEVDKEVYEILTRDKPKINILENVILKSADNSKRTKNDDCASQTSDDFFCSLDVDVVETTPQKNFPSFSKEREQSVLDITLPPPLEFQDSEKQDIDIDPPKFAEPSKIPGSPRRPLSIINKITSTPISQRFDSEKITLSPITPSGRSKPKMSPEAAQENDLKLSSINKNNPIINRGLGPIEIAQRSKFSPLTIIKRPLAQSVVRPCVTPKQKSILNYVRPSQESQESPRSDTFESPSKRKPCIACSRVSREQVFSISSMTNKKLASYSTSFTPKVTHLIVSVNERNCLKDHTIKYVSAVAAGIWVLSFGWIQECLHRNALVPEEPYEVLDVSGLPGPQQSRLTRTINPLFKGYQIYAAPPFASTTQQEVENVIKLLGGKVVKTPEALLDKNGYICVIVTEARATQDFELYETWLEALKVATVDIEWLSRSVGQYQLLSLRPFTLCSDDSLGNLGYPSELTANMTYSFSQQTFSTVPSST